MKIDLKNNKLELTQSYYDFRVIEEDIDTIEIQVANLSDKDLPELITARANMSTIYGTDQNDPTMLVLDIKHHAGPDGMITRIYLKQKDPEVEIITLQGGPLDGHVIQVSTKNNFFERKFDEKYARYKRSQKNPEVFEFQFFSYD